MSRDVPVCNGKCHKGAADPACPLHGKGGKGFAFQEVWNDGQVGEWVCLSVVKEPGEEPRVRWTPL